MLGSTSHSEHLGVGSVSTPDGGSKVKTVKFAICIPCYGDPKMQFTFSLTKMIMHFLQANFQDGEGNQIQPELEVFMISTSMLTESRHRLVSEALFWNADYMLFLDADHVFPEDALARLWAQNLPVVGVNYPRRCTPTAPTAAIDSSDDDSVKHQLYTTREKAEAGLVEECAHMGFGMCLINMKVFDVLQAKAEETGDGNFLPLFQFTPTPDKIGMIGEDVFFFRKLREAGIVAHIDHKLSWEVGHIFDTILTNAHAVAQYDAYIEHKAAKKKKLNDRVEELEQALLP